MTTSHFDRAALPLAQSFYEKELGRLSRPSRGWARANCPFHESKSHTSFSVNLESGGFYCHGCQAKGGNVVDFLQLRDRLDFPSAAKRLGAWRDITATERVEISRREQERERQRAEQEAKQEAERRRLIEARDHLYAVETLYDEAIAEHDWMSMSELLPRVRQAEKLYWQACGFEAQHER